MVLEDQRVRDKIPDLFVPLMVHHLDDLNKVLSPGLTLIRWTSLNLPAFVESALSALSKLELLIDRVVSIHENQLNFVLKEIQTIPLCELPPNETLTVEEFIATTASLTRSATKVVDTKSQIVEKAANELISLLIGPEVVLETPDDESSPGAIATIRMIEQRTKLQHEAENLLLYFEQCNIDALVQLLKSNLEAIRKRIYVHTQTYTDYTHKTMTAHSPLFKSDISLVLPNVVMSPTLDEVQQGLNQAVGLITALTRKVIRWGQEKHTPKPPEGEKPLHSRTDIRTRSRVLIQSQTTSIQLKNYHRPVSEHKEVMKMVNALSTAINSTKKLIDNSKDVFTVYSDLWSEEQSTSIEEYTSKDPSVYDFNNKMEEYIELEAKIMAEPDLITAGMHTRKEYIATPT